MVVAVLLLLLSLAVCSCASTGCLVRVSFIVVIVVELPGEVGERGEGGEWVRETRVIGVVICWWDHIYSGYGH